MATPTFNAMTLPLGRPDIAAANYGVDPSNAHTKLTRIWNDRKTEDGGSKQIFDKITQWATPEAIKARGGNPNDTQWKYVRDYVKTGRVDPKLSPNLATTALGLGLSETARATQHKSNFLDSTFGKILHAVGTVALGAIPVVGPYAAMAAGGLNSAMRTRPNGLGIALGAAGGYLGGQTGAGIASGVNAAGGVGNYIGQIGDKVGGLLGGGGFSNPGALGVSGANLGVNFGSGGFAAAPVAGYGASALGLTGPSVASALGGLGALGGPTAAEIGNQAVGGDPATLYTPKFTGPPAPVKSGVDKALSVANRGLRLGAALAGGAPEQGGGLMTPGAIGAARPMVPHGVPMRPFIPYRYPTPNTNPFMARI